VVLVAADAAAAAGGADFGDDESSYEVDAGMVPNDQISILSGVLA
jgi:hypothetical protein